jgi:signal transduction protein with GAF and PtsI domain
MMEEPSNNSHLAKELRGLLASIEATGKALLPASDLELLQSVVDAAARIFGAAAASICLVDEAEGILEFKVACGAGSDEILGMRIPVDRGIAGYVANTGQPIAISNVQQDPRFNQEFAKSTGYIPRSILATPLIIGDRVIGVMEVLDKISAPSFGMQDMELLGVFAQQAAIAIAQSQQMDGLEQAVLRGIGRILEGDGATRPGPIRRQAEAATDEQTTRRRELFELAEIFSEIGRAGEAERQACLQVLAAFRDYLRSRPSFR